MPACLCRCRDVACLSGASTSPALGATILRLSVAVAKIFPDCLPSSAPPPANMPVKLDSASSSPRSPAWKALPGAPRDQPNSGGQHRGAAAPARVPASGRSASSTASVPRSTAMCITIAASSAASLSRPRRLMTARKPCAFAPPLATSCQLRAAALTTAICDHNKAFRSPTEQARRALALNSRGRRFAARVRAGLRPPGTPSVP